MHIHESTQAKKSRILIVIYIWERQDPKIFRKVSNAKGRPLFSMMPRVKRSSYNLRKENCFKPKVNTIRYKNVAMWWSTLGVLGQGCVHYIGHWLVRRGLCVLARCGWPLCFHCLCNSLLYRIRNQGWEVLHVDGHERLLCWSFSLLLSTRSRAGFDQFCHTCPLRRTSRACLRCSLQQ